MVKTKFRENRRAPDGEVKDAQRRSLNKRLRIRDSQPDTVSVTPSLAYLQVADTKVNVYESRIASKVTYRTRGLETLLSQGQITKHALGQAKLDSDPSKIQTRSHSSASLVLKGGREQRQPRGGRQR